MVCAREKRKGEMKRFKARPYYRLLNTRRS
nr:MAG TPA: hypothetical protein [Caudoviricetes sp.]